MNSTDRALEIHLGTDKHARTFTVQVLLHSLKNVSFDK